MSFGPPFFGGGSVPFYGGVFSSIRNLPTTVTLNGKQYPIDLKEYRHNGVARFRQGVVTSGDPNDQLLSPEGSWWRYRISWHLGAGQDIDELDESSSPFRFLESRGLDPWNKYEICLLPATEPVRVLEAGKVVMISTGGYLYYGVGTKVVRSADLTTWVEVTGLTGTVRGLASDGSSCYISTSTNIFVVGSAISAATVTSATAPASGYDQLAFVANRLLASSENVLFEVGPTALTTIYTHFQPAFRWTVIFAVGSRVYVGGYAGNRSELYTVTTLADGTLARSAEAASFFSGELLLSALSYGGSVVLGTSEGVRFATLSGDANLSYGPLTEAPGAVVSIAAQGRFAWFTFEDFPGAASGVGRLALDEFVDTLQPPYATDVFTEAVDGTVDAVVRFNGRTVFAVRDEDIYASSLTAKVTSGYVDSGDITFGTVEPKQISEVLVRHTSLRLNEKVKVEVLDRAGALLESKVGADDGTSELSMDVSAGTQARTKVRVTLEGNGSTGPCMTEWRMRGIPVAPGIEEWLVPLIIHSRVVVNDSEGQALSLDPWKATAEIRELWQSSKIVRYVEGVHPFEVRIDNFQIGAAEWRDGSDWLEVTCTVRLLSV